MIMHWNQKYKPKKSEDIFGQETAVPNIKKQITSYGKIKKALLLYGPTGTGKTSAIHAIAEELDLELIEVNASDARNSEALEQKIMPAIQQHSLFGRGKIILIDEMDGIAGREDRGGVPSIVKIIEESRFPVILTANDPWDQKFSAIRQKSTMIEFKAVSFLATVSLLKKICEKENIDIDEDGLNHLARASGGDLRAAITDLQNVSSTRTKTNGKITKKDVENTSEREREETIINSLLKIFKTTNPDIALRAYENIDEDIDKIFLWLDENLPKEYTKIEDLANAYENMSLADVYFGRIRRWQYYRYYVYIYQLLSAGIALSKKEKNPNFIQYGPTQRILKIWMANQKNAKKKDIASKLSPKLHTSKKQTMKNVPYFSVLVKHGDKKFIEKFSKEFELEKEDLEALRK